MSPLGFTIHNTTQFLMYSKPECQNNNPILLTYIAKEDKKRISDGTALLLKCG